MKLECHASAHGHDEPEWAYGHRRMSAVGPVSVRVDRSLLAIALLLASLAACTDPDLADSNLIVTKDQLGGDDWPLTVASGVIGCQRESRGVTIDVGGITYSLNGTAAGAGQYGDLRTIWAKDPNDKTKNRDLGPLIRVASQRCGY